MKAKVKYQEVDYIQYNGTNKKEIEEFIGNKQCGEYKEDLYPWTFFLVGIIDNKQVRINNRDIICKTNDDNIFILTPEQFIKMFTAKEGHQCTLSL